MKPHGRLLTNSDAPCGGVFRPTDISNKDAAGTRQSMVFNKSEKSFLERIQVAGDIDTYTIFGWFNLGQLPSKIGSEMALVSFDGAGASSIEVYLSIDTNNNLIFRTRDLGTKFTGNWKINETNAWVAFMVTRSDANISLWLNGKSLALTTDSITSSSNHPVNNPYFTMYIGDTPEEYTAANKAFDGLMTMVGLHDGVAHADMSAFGFYDSTTGKWVPKDPDTSGWSDNSFYLSGKEETDNDYFNLIEFDGIEGTKYINDFMVNGVDLAIVGNSSGTSTKRIYDTMTGDDYYIQTRTTAAGVIEENSLEFIPGGVKLGQGTDTNSSGDTMMLLGFKSAPEIGVEILEFTGDGSGVKAIPHNLNAEPKFAILINYENSSNTLVWVKDMVGDGQTLYLNDSAGVTSRSNSWVEDGTNSTHFTVGSSSNASGIKYKLYLFANSDFVDVQITDINSATVVTPLPFKPKFLFWKRSNNASWSIAHSITENDVRISGLSNDTATSLSTTGYVTANNEYVRTGQSVSIGKQFFTIAFADTTAIKDFGTSSFGNLKFQHRNFPPQYSVSKDTPFNSYLTMSSMTQDSGYVETDYIQSGGTVYDSPGPVGAGFSSISIPNKGNFYLEFIPEIKYNGSSLVFTRAPNESPAEAGLGGQIQYGPTDVTTVYIEGQATGRSSGTKLPPSETDYVGVLVNRETGVLKFIQNGDTSKTILVTGNMDWLTAPGNIYVGIQKGWTVSAPTRSILNLGQYPFLSSPEEDYDVLDFDAISKNFQIFKPDDHCKLLQWTGTGTTPQAITDVGYFSTFIEKDTSSATGWRLYSTHFGDSKYLTLNDTSILEDETPESLYTKFEPDGIEIKGDLSSGHNSGDQLGILLRPSSCAGMSIQYGVSGALTDVTSDMRIRKRTDVVGNWIVTSPSGLMGISNSLQLNTNVVEGIQSFTDGEEFRIDLTVIPGFSACGSYVGNGDTDGPSVYCGFRPAFIIRKSIDSTENWIFQFDNGIDGNVINEALSLNDEGGTFMGGDIIFTTYGFKVASTSLGNTNNNTYIYYAFAKAPLGFVDVL